MTKKQTQFIAEELAQFINFPSDQQVGLAHEAYHKLCNQTGQGSEFLGWLNLPSNVDITYLEEINEAARELQQISDVVVVVGIGGSYLGARAVIEALENPFKHLLGNSKTPSILFAGNSLSEDYHAELLKLLEHKNYSIVVISKSGTTTEPAIAFRILKDHCEKKYGKIEAQKRIVAITDASKGALKQMSIEENYKTFVIDDNIGGRYSVLSPVGLLPIAIAGFDIKTLVEGAANMHANLFSNRTYETNIAMQYAMMRHLMYLAGRKTEMFVVYEPQLAFFIEWLKQLFGESEGKDGKGIFPTGAVFSTDLHSLGQYIQDGEKMMFETVLSVENSRNSLRIPCSEQDLDGLNYLQHRSITEINQIAEEGARKAHVEGKVPNLRIVIPQINELTLGELIYFFEFACALSCYMLGVNPFDQPGVEAYKKNMFNLLGKDI